MDFILQFVLALLAICAVSNAQCMMRTLVPMTYVEQCTPYAAPMPAPASSATDDLSALLLLARALSNEKNEKPAETNSSHSFNVEDIITKLINALVYTTTQNVGKSYNPVGHPIENPDTCRGSSHSNPAPKPSNAGENRSEGEGLIDLSLLDDTLADLDIAGKDILNVDVAGLGSNKSDSDDDSDSNGGLVGGLLSTVL